MNNTLGKIVATGVLVGALAVGKLSGLPTPPRGATPRSQRGSSRSFGRCRDRWRIWRISGIRRLLRRPSLCLWRPTVSAPLLSSSLVQIAKLARP